MISENIMAQGSFEIPLRRTVPYSLWRKLEPFGHIVIFPQWIDPNQTGDTAALDAARYAGPLLVIDTEGEGIKLKGAGMSWWLGDDQGNGPQVESAQFSSNTLSDAIAAVLPDAVTVGTINNAGVSSVTGDFYWESCLEVIRAICLGVGAEFRVNPDGTIDAGLNSNVFIITNPEVVVVRRGFGSDSTYAGVPVENMRSWIDGHEYVTDVAVVSEKNDGTKELIDSVNRADTHFDIHGNAFTRTRVIGMRHSNPINMATYALSVLNSSVLEKNQEVTTEHYELVGGNFAVGDTFYAYDPPAFVDETVQINFRGDVINPVKLRLTAASWPLRSGMGVWYRGAHEEGVTEPEWIDLTQYVAWEGEGGEFS